MDNSPICVDASLVMRLLASGKAESPAVQLWREWHTSERPLIAPTLLYYEVSNALRRYVAQRELLPEEAAEALEAALRPGHYPLRRCRLTPARSGTRRAFLAPGHLQHPLPGVGRAAGSLILDSRPAADAGGTGIPALGTLVRSGTIISARDPMR
jgi:hypothetical protein